VLMPVMPRRRGGQPWIVAVSKVAAVDHVTNAHLGVAVVVVVRAEDPAEAVNGKLIRIAEVVGENPHLGAVEVHAAHDAAVRLVPFVSSKTLMRSPSGSCGPGPLPPCRMER